MANVNVGPNFFPIDITWLKNINPKPYHVEGTILQLPANDICPLANKTFAALRQANFQANFFPYTIVYIQCKNSGIFCDGQAAIRHLEKSFPIINPKTGETAEKVYLLYQGMSQLPFYHLEDCEKALSQEIKTICLTCSLEDTQEVRDTRRAFLVRGSPYNFHGQDLIPLFERAIQENGPNCALLQNAGAVYHTGSNTLKKDFQKAAFYYEEAAKLEPTNTKVLLLLVKMYRSAEHGLAKDLKKAEERLLQLLKLKPTDHDILHALSSLYKEKGEAQKIIPFLEEAIKLEPKNLFAIEWLGNLLRQGVNGVPKNLERAAKLWEEVIAIKADHITVLMELAHLYKEGGENFPKNEAKAQAKYEQVLHFDPKHVDALFELGLMLSLIDKGKKSDYEKAEKLLLQAYKIAPKQDYILAALAQLYYCVTPDLQKSVFYCEAVLKLNAKNEFVPRIYSQILLEGGPNVPQDIPRGVKLAEEALVTYPDEIPIIIKLANVYQSGSGTVPQNIPRAIALWKKAFAENPAIFDTFRKESLVAPIQLFRQALKTSPNDMAAQEILGILLLHPHNENPNDESEGIKLLESIKPTTITALRRLGEFYENGGKTIAKNWKRAKEYYEQVLERDQNNQLAAYALAFILFTGSDDVAKDWARTEKLLTGFCKLNPELPSAYSLLGEIYQQGGFGVVQDNPKALQCFETALKLNPNYSFALASLGFLLYRGAVGIQQDKEKGLALAEKAVRINRNDGYVQGILSHMCGKKQNPPVLTSLLQPNRKPKEEDQDIELHEFGRLEIDDRKEAAVKK